MMTQEQFEENFEFQPSLGYDDEKKETTVSLKVWDNNTGNEVFSLDLPNPHDRFKDIDFYEREEWNEMKSEVLKVFYQLHSILSEK